MSGSNPATGTYSYYTHDNLQSTRGVWDQSKNSLGGFEYTPFGEGYTTTGPSGITHRYTGLDLDSLTGKYYAPYRYYDPNAARWMTPDPLGMADGPNVYAYVRQNPLSWTDPLGLAQTDWSAWFKCILNLSDADFDTLMKCLGLACNAPENADNCPLACQEACYCINQACSKVAVGPCVVVCIRGCVAAGV